MPGAPAGDGAVPARRAWPGRRLRGATRGPAVGRTAGHGKIIARRRRVTVPAAPLRSPVRPRRRAGASGRSSPARSRSARRARDRRSRPGGRRRSRGGRSGSRAQRCRRSAPEPPEPGRMLAQLNSHSLVLFFRKRGDSRSSAWSSVSARVFGDRRRQGGGLAPILPHHSPMDHRLTSPFPPSCPREPVPVRSSPACSVRTFRPRPTLPQPDSQTGQISR